jgi:3-phenylpropionate/trans-cinnamate dioxygenase ferredoxin subunit
VESRRVAVLAEVPPGQPTLVEVDGLRIVLTRIGDAVYACGDVCAHRGGHLSEGRLSGTRLACPLHGWLYDVRTGQCLFPGRGASVPSWPAQVRDGDVFLDL